MLSCGARYVLPEWIFVELVLLRLELAVSRQNGVRMQDENDAVVHSKKWRKATVNSTR